MLHIQSSALFRQALANFPKCKTEYFSLYFLQKDEESRGRIWVGVITPKRFARRAVTRNLLKRQIYSVVKSWIDAAQPAFGFYVFRLRKPWSQSQFKSAASKTLKLTVKQEIKKLLEYENTIA